MNGHLLTTNGKELELTQAEVERLLHSSEPFWLDLADADEGTPEHALLRDTFHFHPLALEDAERFGERPKLDNYDDFAFLVVYGPGRSDHLVEVHCFAAENYLVTLHRHDCPNVDEVRRRTVLAGGAMAPIMVLYRVVLSLVDGYFPWLADFDDQIDDLEDAILNDPTDQQLGQLFDMKRSLIVLRKVVSPQRDVFATLSSTIGVIPGMTPEYERYFRDIYDHLLRVSDLVDSYRDLLSGVLDTQLSTVNNRLQVVMKQLTIIASIFLPLSFITGFFGQNFDWMVAHIMSMWAFITLGLFMQVAAGLALVLWFKRRGWLASKGTVPAAVPAHRVPTLSHLRWLALHPMQPRTVRDALQILSTSPSN
jgi:magnesium transporter